MSGMIIFPIFMDRKGTYVFREPSSVWGYLPQLHEWAMKTRVELTWEAERIGGKDHMPDFKAIPVFMGERLEVFAAYGPSKKEAKEEAARLMATSGHCVSTSTWLTVIICNNPCSEDTAASSA
ncbi:hypothetical protein C8Q80DRAFT_21308 [Daedaleopsis nitida]|nr:hypothetical protein C8Q80DRAFT_21308 [Daedaleopsis nitida]